MPKCIVILPTRKTSEEHDKGYWDLHFEEFISPAIEDVVEDGIVLPFTAVRSDVIKKKKLSDLFHELINADLVLADLTDLDSNVLYELGIRHSLKKRSILLIEEGQEKDIPRYFRDVHVISYRPAEKFRHNARSRREIQAQLIKIKNNQDEANNPIFPYLESIDPRPVFVSKSTEGIYNEIEQSGITNFYVSQREGNQKRNLSKSQAIKHAKEYVRLVAVTGSSYLLGRNARFRGGLIDKMERCCKVEILLLNPWTPNGFQIALGEIDSRQSDKKKANFQSSASYNTYLNDRVKVSELQHKIWKSIQRHKYVNITNEDCVNLIKNSKYYKEKFDLSTQGYENILQSDRFKAIIESKNKEVDLATKEGEKIKAEDIFELKICNFQIPATVLLTDQVGFFEPYIHVNENLRADHLLLTFEHEFTNESYMHNNSQAYFQRLWHYAVPYAEFKKMEKTYQDELNPDSMNLV